MLRVLDPAGARTSQLHVEKEASGRKEALSLLVAFCWTLTDPEEASEVGAGRAEEQHC